MNLTGLRIRFNLTGPVRDLVKHSGVYGLGQILGRLASILLLPVYTRYLSPTDYGIISILDLTVGVLGIVIGSGMGAALSRYHFSARDNVERDEVWWTGLTFVVIVSTLCIVPLWFCSGAVAHLTLGPSVPRGEAFYSLILPTLWFAVIGGLPDAYLKTRKWSGISVGLNLARLILNVGLNLYFLIVLRLGVTGLLLGNLITGGVITVVFLVVMSNSLGSYAFHWPLIPKLWRFGSPLIITGILSIILHQADRYFIRAFLDLDQVGIYSFAYTVGQAVNTLVLGPFLSIWNVMVYEIAHRSDAKRIYVQVFVYFTYSLSLFIFGVALFGRQLLGLLVPENYLAGADLIPIVCLGYLFFSLHEHFKVPVMLAKKTSDLLPVFATAVLVDTVLNSVLIPAFGSAGAAWASVASFATFSFVGLWRYRVVDKYDYPLTKCGAVLGGMIVTYLAHKTFGGTRFSLVESGSAILLWLFWALLLFTPLLRRIVMNEKEIVTEQGAITVRRL